MSVGNYRSVETVVIASVDTLAFQAATEHRRALIMEADGVDWDERLPGWRRKYEAYYRAAFDRGSAVLIAHGNESDCVGTCIASIQDEFRRAVGARAVGYVNGLYVLESFRNRHAGASLVNRSVRWLSEHGCPIVRLHPTSSSFNFYTRLGFKPIRELQYESVPE